MGLSGDSTTADFYQYRTACMAIGAFASLMPISLVKDTILKPAICFEALRGVQ